MLAPDDIVLVLDGRSYTLRPTLRAAIRLERRFGLPKLFNGITAGSLTVLDAILRECGADPKVVFGLQGLGRELGEAQAACMALVVELYGLDETPGEPAPTASRVTHSDHFAWLYRAATGWLGWSPADALDASPAEIAEAATGRRELISDILKAVFGASEDDSSSTPSGPDERRDPNASNILRGLARAA